MGFRRRGEAGEDALKDAENELRRGRSGEEARGDEKEVVAIVGWVAGWKEMGCSQPGVSSDKLLLKLNIMTRLFATHIALI